MRKWAAAVMILALPIDELVASPAPLLLVAARAQWFSSDLFAAIALVAVANGVLIELVMLARLLYGMARRGWLPRGLGNVGGRWHTPIPATLVAGSAVFVFTVALPFLSLVTITSARRRFSHTPVYSAASGHRQCRSGDHSVLDLRMFQWSRNCHILNELDTTAASKRPCTTSSLDSCRRSKRSARSPKSSGYDCHFD